MTGDVNQACEAIDNGYVGSGASRLGLVAGAAARSRGMGLLLLVLVVVLAFAGNARAATPVPLARPNLSRFWRARRS